LAGGIAFAETFATVTTPRSFGMSIYRHIQCMGMANEDVKLMVEVSSDVGHSCPVCKTGAKVLLDGVEHFEAACNHLLSDHGMKLLHVGQRTIASSQDGTAWQTTVAVFGK